jgi:hypothetical protein
MRLFTALCAVVLALTATGCSENVDCVKMEYPRLAAQANIQGRVTITMTVNFEDGQITKMVVDPTGAHPILVQAARDHAFTFKFAKNRFTSYAVEYSFMLDNSQLSEKNPGTTFKFNPGVRSISVISSMPVTHRHPAELAAPQP